jgi:hypothetical protein
MTELEKQAEELGIKIDGRWSEERIQQEIDKALAAPKAKAEAETPVKLLYDRWGADDIRVKAGTIINVPISEARKLFASGKAERADPLPGEE